METSLHAREFLGWAGWGMKGVAGRPALTAGGITP